MKTRRRPSKHKPIAEENGLFQQSKLEPSIRELPPSHCLLYHTIPSTLRIDALETLCPSLQIRKMQCKTHRHQPYARLGRWKLYKALKFTHGLFWWRRRTPARTIPNPSRHGLRDPDFSSSRTSATQDCFMTTPISSRKKTNGSKPAAPDFQVSSVYRERKAKS